MKLCGGCQQIKPLEDFSKSKQYTKDGLQTRCRKCQNAASKRWRDKNPAKHREAKERWRQNNLERDRAAKHRNYLKYRATGVNDRQRYGVSTPELLELLNRQGGCCALCRIPILAVREDGKTRRAWAVDHDHACCPTGKGCRDCIRGIVCHACNRGLGFYERVRDAAEAYLESPRPLKRYLQSA